MRVTILGSGTAVPNFSRFPAGYAVSEAGRTLLVDLGPGVLRRSAQLGLDLGDLDAVLLTHYHTDHCADVAALLFGLRNPRYAERGPLTIAGGPGLRALIAKLTEAWPWIGPRDYELELVELQPGEHRIAGFDVEAIKIEHTVESLGYRIRGDGAATAAFSGDAVECPNLVPLARDADLFICDSAFPTANPGPGHMTPPQAGRAAEAAGAALLVPTHFYPECDGHDLAAEARSTYGGRIELARDLLAFELGAAPARVIEPGS